MDAITQGDLTMNAKTESLDNLQTALEMELAAVHQ